MKSGNTNNHGSSRANISMVLLLLIVYFIFGFSPFNWKLWTPKVFDNGGVMLAQELRIQSPGIAYTPEAPEWLAKVKETTSLRVLLEIQSDHRKQYGPARIFTVSDDPYRRNLTVAQQGSDLVIRLRSPDTTLNGVPEHVVHNLFGISGWHDIELTVEPMFLNVRVNGETILRIDLPDRALENWDPNYRVALGNELSGGRAWLGRIRKAVVETGNSTYDYLAPNALYIPETLSIPDKYRQLPRFVLSPISWGQPIRFQVMRDIVLNLFGFIPFGLFLANVFGQKRSLLAITAICAAVSFTIEFGQVFLPTRISSFSDLVLNTLGGTIGACLSRRLH